MMDRLPAERLGVRLRRTRVERGLSLRQAAAQTGVTKETLSDLERGRRTPHPPTLAKIAKGYGVEISDLLGPMTEALQEPVAAGKAEAPEEGRTEQRSEEQAGQLTLNSVLAEEQRVQERPSNETLDLRVKVQLDALESDAELIEREWQSGVCTRTSGLAEGRPVQHEIRFADDPNLRSIWAWAWVYGADHRLQKLRDDYVLERVAERDDEEARAFERALRRYEGLIGELEASELNRLREEYEREHPGDEAARVLAGAA